MIDDIRDLIEKIQFSPVVAKAKVYIIDEVHMLTKEAFNALLKTLEEPPAYAYFILATTEFNKIPVTIQSRCQCFPFRQIRDEDIIRRLQFIVDSEKITVDRDALRAIASHSEGGMRDAISLLDQLRSLEKITIDDVKQRVGSTGLEHVRSILEAIDARDQQEILSVVKTIEEEGVPLDVFLRQLLHVLREQLHTAIEEGAETAGIVRILDVLLDAIRDIRIAPVPGLVLEAALSSLCQGEQAAVATPPLAQAAPEKKEVKKEEKPEIKKEAPAKKEEPVATAEDKSKDNAEEPEEESPKEEEAVSDAIVEASDLSVDSIQSIWAAVLKDVQPASVRMSLKNGRVTGVEENTVVITFASAFHKDKVAEAEASRGIEKVLEDHLKRTVRVACKVDTAGEPTMIVDDDAVNLADAAAEIF